MSLWCSDTLMDPQTTQKSTLFKALIGTSPLKQPKQINAYSFDEWLHLYATRLPAFYKYVLRFILSKLTNVNAKEIWVSFYKIIIPQSYTI